MFGCLEVNFDTRKRDDDQHLGQDARVHQKTQEARDSTAS